MRPHFSENLRQKLRLTAIMCFGTAVLGLAAAAIGLGRADLYQATTTVADHSEAAQESAFQFALRIVLVRVTGRRTAGDDPALAPLLGNARRYVQQYRSAPDNQLWVAFDGAAIERWLTQNGQPLWGRDRPATLVWLVVQNGSQGGNVLTADDKSELKDVVVTAAEARGIPLIWPSSAAATEAGGNAAPAALAEIAHRLSADAVLTGRASSTAATANMRWNLQFQDHNSDFAGTVEGVNRTADLYAGIFAASGSLAPLDIDVSGVADTRDYASVQAYLESLTFIAHVGVEGLSGDTVRFRLTTRGGIEPLQHAIALSGRLQPLPVGDNGIQRFQLHRQ
jgi:hypothetical protein